MTTTKVILDTFLSQPVCCVKETRNILILENKGAVIPL